MELKIIDNKKTTNKIDKWQGKFCVTFFLKLIRTQNKNILN